MDENIFFHFWYIRDLEERKPRVTVCFAYDRTTETFARGIAVCSQPDNPSKEIGRDLSKARALRSLNTCKSDTTKKVLMRGSKTFPKSLGKGRRRKQINSFAPYFQMYMPTKIKSGEARFVEMIKERKE